MTQPYSECTGDVVDLPQSDVAGWIGWIVVLVSVAIFDIWLHKHRKDTMSEKVRRTAQKWLAFRLFVVVTMVLATIHFVWGFPW